MGQNCSLFINFRLIEEDYIYFRCKNNKKKIVKFRGGFLFFTTMVPKST